MLFHPLIFFQDAILVLAERRCTYEDFDAFSQKLIDGANGTTDRRKVAKKPRD